MNWQTRLPKPEEHFPSPITQSASTCHCKRNASWRQNSIIFFFVEIPSVSSEEQALPRLACCELSQFRCNGQSLLLPSYLCKIKQKNSFCSACGHQLQDLTYFLLDCPASEPLQRVIFGTTFSIFDL